MGGFDLDKTVEYWRSGARYDLGVAGALLKARKYPYALFMGHLAVEKLLKAHTTLYLKSIRRIYRWLADQLRRS